MTIDFASPSADQIADDIGFESEILDRDEVPACSTSFSTP